MKKFFMTLVLLFFCVSHSYSQPAVKMVVLLDWFANPNHAPLFVAKEEGFFKLQGLEVELIGPADPSDPPKLAAANKAHVAITYEPSFIQQVDRGLPLVRIGTLIDRPLNALVVLENGPIKNIGDLKNKRVGFSTGDMNSTTVAVMLNNANLSLNDIQHINVHYDLTQALLSKNLDAVTGMMRNFELIQMELVGQPGRAFFPEKHGLPSYSELIFVTHKQNITDPKIKAFLTALKQGVEYLLKHPDACWQKFSKKHPELNNELNHRAWFETLNYFAKDPSQFNTQEWLRFANFMYDKGLIKQVQPISTYAVTIKE